MSACSRRPARLVGMLTAALAACSGGGGSGDAGGGDVSVTMDRSSVAFAGLSGGSFPAQVVRFTVSGSGQYYAGVGTDRPDVFGLAFEATGERTGQVVITVRQAPPGRISGEFEFALCEDAACRIRAWSGRLPYTLVAFGVSASAVDLAAAESERAAATLTVTPADDAGQLTVASTAAWITAARTSPTEITVTADATGVTPGPHQANLILRVTGSVDRLLPVSFQVAPGLVAPPSRSVVLDLDSAAGATAGTLPVAFNAGGDRAWTASSDRPWLVLGPGATGPGDLSLAVDTSTLGTVRHGWTDVATVTISSPDLTPVTAAVTVESRLPEITMLSPAAVHAGVAATARAFGRGLSQLGGARGVSVGGIAGVTATVISDHEVELSLPALAAGRVEVSVPNAVAVPTASVELAAVPARTWTAAFVPNAGEIRSAVYDAGREALFAVNVDQSMVVRSRIVDGAWAVDGVPVASVGDLALSPDGRTLYVTQGVGTLREIDPDTLTLRERRHVLAGADPYGPSLDAGWGRTAGIPVTNDGRLWFAGSQWSALRYFDAVSAAFAVHPLGGLYGPRMNASGDGSRMVITISGLSPRPPGSVYTAADGRAAQPTGLPEAFDVVLNRDGSRAVADDLELYATADWSLLGRPVVEETRIGGRALLSPDGTRVYRMATANQNTTLVDGIAVLDATALVPGTTALVKLGELPVSERAANCEPSYPYGCMALPAMVLSPFGDVIFLVGNQGLTVHPIPEALRGVGSTTTR